MEIQIITLLSLFFIFIVLDRLNYHNDILKKIILEDRLETHLNEPLTIEHYEKIYNKEFTPYLMKRTSNINVEIFENFKKFYDARVIDEKFDQPDVLHIVFVNKIDGYLNNSQENTYEIIIKNDFIPFTTNDKKNIEIVDRFLSLKYTEMNEYSLNGIIKINEREHFLSDLTSISSYKNTINNKDYSVLVFNFGNITESIAFNTFEDVFDYLFTNRDSDIRLIEKIANTSLIKEIGGNV